MQTKKQFSMPVALVALSVLVLLSATSTNAAMHLTPSSKVKTFSTAIKGHRMCPCQTCVGKNCSGCVAPFNSDHAGCMDSTNFETELYTYQPNQPGVIRLLWFTAELLATTMQGNTTIRVYVDDEATASAGQGTSPAVTFKVYEAHAMGFGWDQGEKKTWGTKHFGKGSMFGGLYMTFHIPFEKQFRITAQLPEENIHRGESWIQYFICRGLLNVPVMLDGGAFNLPTNAKLKVERTELMEAKAGTVLAIGNASQTAGSVFLVTMETEGSTPHYLEGEFKATLDGELMTLSSGTEDYFLSANYFNAGEFQFPNSGATHVDLACLDPLKKGLGICRVAAYRFHEADPIFFSDSMQLTWEVGDGVFGHFEPIRVRFYVWTYEY